MSVFLGNLFNKEDKSPTISSESDLTLKQLLHDIKSPIMAVMAGVDYIQKNDTTADRTQDALNILKMATERLNALTNVSDEHLEHFSPTAAVLDIVAEKQFSGFKNIQIKQPLISETVTAIGTTNQFKAMLSNLINNAIEAHASDLEIDLKDHQGFITLSMKDDGCGIEKHKINFINKGRTGVSDKIGGQGLGLSHAIKTLKSWGGDLSIESRIGMGTTVTVLMKKA